MSETQEFVTAPETPAPKGREITNIRSHTDGTYVVSINGENGLIPDYHVCPPEVDPFAPVGLWDEVVALVKKTRKKLPAYVSDVEPPPMDHSQALSQEKAEAARVIGLMQMEADVYDLNADQLDHIREWKRYRIALERTGLQPDTPVKPDWIE